MNKLECHKLCKSFEIEDDNINVLNNIDLVIEAGDSIAITGKSGAGKSTLLHILATLDRPTSGSVLLDGDNLTNSSNENLSKVRLNNFGFVYQFHHLLEDLTVEENISIPLHLNNSYDLNCKKMINHIMKELDIHKRSKHLPWKLSGGEKQRVAIARSIINKPKYLFLDEPTGNLDVESSSLIQQLIFNMASKYGIALIAATHDNKFTDSFKKVYILSDSKLNKVNE